MRMSRKLTYLAALAGVFFVSANPAKSQTPPNMARKSVVFFKYVGADAGQEKRALDNFRSITRDALQSTPPPIEFTPINSSPPALPDRDRYQKTAAALALVDGRVFGTGPIYTVSNTIFLGDLHGLLIAPQFSLNVVLSIKEAPPAADTLAAVALYARAMDELRIHASKDQVFASLAAALNVIRHAENHGGGANVATLKAAIEESAAQLAGVRP
jgi:hypothetical protein